MTIKEKLENNIIFWTLAMLLAGFLSGFAAYKGILEIAKLEVISRSELDELRMPSTNSVSDIEKKALNRLVADRIEWSLKVTAGKLQVIIPPGSTEYEEIQYKRLRKSIFLNLLYFEADDTILKNALESLERRGHAFVAIHITRIVAELPRIKSERLRWVEDKAIPALSEEIKLLSQSPIQGGASVKVPLPQIAWILDHTNGSGPVVIVNDMSTLLEEVSLLKGTI